MFKATLGLLILSVGLHAADAKDSTAKWEKHTTRTNGGNFISSGNAIFSGPTSEDTVWRLIKSHQILANIVQSYTGDFILSDTKNATVSYWDDLSAAKAEAERMFGDPAITWSSGNCYVTYPLSVPLLNGSGTSTPQ